MPKEKKFERNIPAFYRKNAVDIMLYTHVTVMIRDGMTIRKGIYDFLDFYNISPDDYDIDTAMVTYHNMRQKFMYASIKDGNIEVKKKI
jgi:hypothetical protein